jgi:signal transduction histidine kinase
VQVSQLHEVRREIATNAALCALLPIAGLFPLSCILVAIGVGRILKPLSDVTRAVTQRDVSSLTPLPGECIPHEVAPLIAEMNSLLLRVRVGIESQRHFVLDAAHELRTPLTALRLQIENLSQSRSKEDLHMRIVELKSGMQRAAHLVEQLLKMARYEAQSPSKKDRVELGEIVKICLGDFIPIAEQRGIDLGIVRFETAFIRANADELRVLLDNLLDNAIRYTPTGGQVDVSVIVSAQKAIVTITDNGRGIPDDLLQRVFDRFFRAGGLETEGSGIGLAIVKTIAQRESAEITLCNRSDGHGLIASVALDIFAAA